jgi:hypothetical protein
MRPGYPLQVRHKPSALIFTGLSVTIPTQNAGYNYLELVYYLYIQREKLKAMKLRFLFALFSTLNLTVFCQSNEIINIALRDKSNFKVMTFMGAKMPHKLIVLETKGKWEPQTFLLDSVDLDNPEGKKQMDSGTYKKYNDLYRHSYRNPYLNTYIFKDPTFKFKADKIERMQLRERALKQTIGSINSLKKGRAAVNSYAKIRKGFFMAMKEPIFSSDKKYAFIGFEIFLKEAENASMDECSFGNVKIVYEKQPDNNWKRIFCKPYKMF